MNQDEKSSSLTFFFLQFYGVSKQIKFIYLGLLLLLHGGQPVFLDSKETSSRISITVANDGLVEVTVLVQSSINLNKIT